MTVSRLAALFPQFGFDDDKLREQLIDYQVMDSAELPQEKQVDRFWGLIGKQERFSELARLSKTLLCIPHSNASSERVFSMVTKIMTTNRMSLERSTVCALLSCKLNHSDEPHQYMPSQKVLRHAKSATYLYNSAHATAAES